MTRLQINNAVMRHERSIQILEAIKQLDVRVQRYLEWSKVAGWSPSFKNQYLHKAYISDMASQRLEKYYIRFVQNFDEKLIYITPPINPK